MKAALLKGKLDISVEEVPLPEIGDDEILLKVKAASICGSDVRMYKNGYQHVSKEHPLIIGHEFAGVIEKIGKQVTAYEVGQRVAVAPNMGCGTCDHCVSGETHLCEHYQAFGINMNGGFAEYVKIPATAIQQGNITVLQDAISFAEAALVEPLSCVYNGQKRLHMTPGKDVLIIGAGPIGIMHIMVAKLFGAAKVFMNDLSRERMEQAKKLFPDLILVEGDLQEEICKHTGKGVDVCIIAATAPTAQTQSLQYMNMNGQLLFFGGLPKDRENVSLNTNLVHYKQLSIYGCTRQSVMDYRLCSKLVNDKRIPLNSIISATYPIDDFMEAMDKAAHAVGLKHVITFA